jgi:hypothetical protein
MKDNESLLEEWRKFYIGLYEGKIVIDTVTIFEWWEKKTQVRIVRGFTPSGLLDEIVFRGETCIGHFVDGVKQKEYPYPFSEEWKDKLLKNGYKLYEYK